MATTPLQVVLTFQQSPNISEEELQAACEHCYIPIIDKLEANPGAKVALSFGGQILDYLSRRQPELLVRLKQMVEADRLELLGGLFYGGAPAMLPEGDLRGQIQMTAEYWESFAGAAPAGFWLSDLSWSPELPRLLDETGLEYGFVSSSRVSSVIDETPRFGSIERGGQSVAAFVLDADLSSTLPAAPVDDWIDAVIARGPSSNNAPITVWIRAESLGLDPGTAQWCLEQGWLGDWLAAIGGGRAEIESVLPRTSFKVARPIGKLELSSGIAAELEPLGRTEGDRDWPDFISEFAEVDALYRRMLRTSDKLREAITTMEEEELDDDWSDALATAQRLIFAAQSSEAYWRSATPGFGDPALRDGVVSLLIRAGSMLDALVQGEDDWIASEEEDRDSDLVDEVFVANRKMQSWIVPARGAMIRTLDDRNAERNLLDVGQRRAEPFFAAMQQAPLRDDATSPDGAPRRGLGLRRLAAELPTDQDEVERIGISEYLLDADTSMAEFFSGTVVDPLSVPAEIIRNEIDEEDATFHMEAKIKLERSGLRDRSVTINKVISIPIDAAEVTIDYTIEASGEGESLVAVQIPVRLGSTRSRVTVNGNAMDPVECDSPDVGAVRFEAADHSALEVTLEPALDCWLMPVRTTVRDLAGYRAVDNGFLLAALIRVGDRAEGSVKISLQSPP